MALNIPTISPSQAVMFQQGGNLIIPFLPVPQGSCKYFQLASDQAKVLAQIQTALAAWVTANSQNGNGAVNSVTLSNCQLNADGTVACAFFGMMSSEQQPVFIYTDTARVYTAGLISFSITFQPPLPPDQPGPYNPPQTIAGQVSIGDISGPGGTIGIRYEGGSFSFVWE
jgi:hypothetical protein